MAKLKNRKPLQKYQTGGNTNDPWGFPTSGLLNPFNYDITKGLTGTGTLDVMKPGQNFINFGDNPFGQQIGESSVKTANMLQGLFPTDPLPAGADTYNKLQRQIAKEQDLVLKDGQWRSAKTGEKVYSSKEMNNLINLREAQENQKREENKKLAPLATPLVMLNELGEAQKKSYAQAQKESMYDVTKSPLSMESKGFFAKEGMRTPPVAEVYRMMGAHQGLPETSYKLAKTLDFKSAKQKDLNDLLEQIVMEEGGNVGYSNIPKAQEGIWTTSSLDSAPTVNSTTVSNKEIDRIDRINKLAAQVIKKNPKDYTNEDLQILSESTIKDANKYIDRYKIERANAARKEGWSSPQKFAEATSAIGSRLSLQNTPVVGEYVPEILDVTRGIGEMASGLGRVPQNVQEGNYGQAALNVLTPIAAGALAGVGAKTTGQFVNNLVNPLAGVSIKPSKNFKSEIDWAKWNPDTPKYPELINEYNAIEEATKKSRTWMKNPDGSAFQGTPEQFIQQQSSWFKKAFPNVIKNKFGSPQLNYHGSPSKFSEISPDKEVNGRIYGEGLYTTPNLDLAKSYAVGDNPQLYEFYINANNPRDASNYIQEGIAKADEKLNKILKEFGENSKEYKKGLDEYNEELEYLRKNRTKIDLRKHSIGEAEDYMRVKDVQVTPFDNRVKSAIGNVGFFDMTNPNIYKALLPAAATSALLQQDDLILNRQQGGNVTSAINEIENLQKIQNNMYNNNQRVSKLAMLLGGGLIRGYQEGGIQQPMSPEEEQMMMEQAMQQEMAMQQGQQQPMPQQGGGMEGQPQQGQPQPQPGENKYMQLPPEQQVEVYKQIIDFVMENGIDTLEQQYPEEYQFFEEFGDMLEGEEMEGEEEEMGGEMETEAGRMEMGGGEEMESEYPTDEEEVPVGARPGENAMRPAQPMEGAEQMKEGGIPQRYRNMGFTKVGQKRQSDRPGKKWAVLAKKGNQYKIVHGGAKGMEDFKQHGNKDRQKRFWDRMGGKDSAKANDPFSPLYWHKRFGTW